ncbi:hypothetical protein MCSF7_00206 [Mycoplasmopsis columbina SF7]|uniref:HNH nuclease domain-containing protein n=1 Tax=Mycoplasmopsis columbina SF7 TaxID=1037410 RepID=F9UJJ6_9BACT|nr:HNH endonuclease signature motif containing protein [Mycoplasmopsis columbina]EGV00377.1 hypothetical protein MCSF7_00206 [Mycoplasmopsis columbina SF7]
MQINRDKALALWEKHYGYRTEAKDFAGRIMYKNAYGNQDSDYGWNIHHIFPVAKGGTNIEHNLVCANIETNWEAGDKINFWANGRLFSVQKVEAINDRKAYEIFELEN